MYKLQQNGVKRLLDGAAIPADHGNKDYQEYLEWLAAGNTPQPEFTAEEIAEADAAEAAKLAELVTEDEFRAKYGLTTMKYAALEDLELATKNILAEVGGANKAIEMLAMAVALIDRRMTRRGL